MDINDQIAKEIKAEEEKKAKDSVKPVTIQRGQIVGSKWAWMLGAVAIDVATGYAIWQITYWYYGLIWIFAGAGGLIYSDWLRERVGNNLEQRDISQKGIDNSWIAIIAMAIVAGVVYVLGYAKNPYVEVLTILTVIGLFAYHVRQSYRYYIIDDEYLERTEDARADAQNKKEIRQIHRVANKIDAKKQVHALVDDYKGQHGAAMQAALPGLYQQVVDAPQIIKKPRSDGQLAGGQKVTYPPVTQAKQYTVDELLAHIGKSKDEVAELIKAYNLSDPNKAFQALRGQDMLPADLSHGNFVRLYRENFTSGGKS